MQALNLTASGSAVQPWVSNGGTIVKSEAASQSISVAPPAPPLPPQEHEEDETPMICMICEDKATGLHYGIITCEGWVILAAYEITYTRLSIKLISHSTNHGISVLSLQTRTIIRKFHHVYFDVSFDVSFYIFINFYFLTLFFSAYILQYV